MSEAVFTTVHVTWELPTITTPFEIIPTGDWHQFTGRHHTDAFKQFLSDLRATVKAKPTKIIIMGDERDSVSTKERKAIEAAGLHGATVEKLDESMADELDSMEKQLKDLAPHIIGMLEGNHHWVFHTTNDERDYRKGETSTQRLCRRLGVHWLGGLAYIRLSLRGKNTTVCSVVDIVACHGKAGGKLVGTTINQVEDLRGIFPSADLYCVPEDTEILTPEGFVGIKDVPVGSCVYSLNTKSGAVELDTIRKTHSYYHQGDMVSIKARGIDALVTPAHRVVYRWSVGCRSWKVKSARSLASPAKSGGRGGQCAIPVAADALSMPLSSSGLSNACVSLIGWVLAEGSIRKRKDGTVSAILLTQKSKRGIDKIQALLSEAGIAFSSWARADGCRIFYIGSKEAHKLPVDTKTRLPAWAFHCAPEEFELLLQSFIDGDGSRQKTGTGATLYTVSKDFAEDWQRALFLHGYRTRLYFAKGGFKTGCWRVLLTKHTTTEAPRAAMFKSTVFAGTVYCVTTDNGTFVARRNGKVFITGNCMGHDHKRGVWPASYLEVPHGTGGFNKESKKGKGADLIVKQRRYLLCRTGSFMRGYVPGKSSYIVQRLLKPSELGIIRILGKVKVLNTPDGRREHRLDLQGLS